VRAQQCTDQCLCVCIRMCGLCVCIRMCGLLLMSGSVAAGTWVSHKGPCTADCPIFQHVREGVAGRRMMHTLVAKAGLHGCTVSAEI
jgi:hypothetical protein